MERPGEVGGNLKIETSLEHVESLNIFIKIAWKGGCHSLLALEDHFACNKLIQFGEDVFTLRCSDCSSCNRDDQGLQTAFFLRFDSV